MSSRVPSILFIGSVKGDLGGLITKVTDVAVSTDAAGSMAHVGDWQIDCKYYTATVQLKIGSMSSVPTSKDRVEALVALFDATSEPSIASLFAYMDQLKYKPDVCLAVCQNFENSAETYENIELFCREKGFELIELAPLPENISNPEEEGESSSGGGARYESESEYGVTRIVNALQSNPWTGMKRKKWQPNLNKSELESGGGAGGEAGSGSGQNPETDKLAEECAVGMAAAFSPTSQAAPGPAPGSQEDMGDLFAKLKQLKAKAASLSDEDRKKYAEKVALSFAQATGLDQ